MPENKVTFDLAKLVTWGDLHCGVVQLQTSSRLPGWYSRADCSHKDGENIIWILSLFFLHILSHILSLCHCHFFTCTVSLSLYHRHCITVTVSLSLCHYRCVTVTVSLSLCHCNCVTVTVSLSLCLCHFVTVTVTLSL